MAGFSLLRSQLTRGSLVRAPEYFTCSPWEKKIRVGNPLTSYLDFAFSWSSQLIFASFTVDCFSANSLATSIYTGASLLQCPHHGAQNSMRMRGNSSITPGKSQSVRTSTPSSSVQAAHEAKSKARATILINIIRYFQITHHTQLPAHKRNMEPNFIIFPSPKCSSISHIIHNIYLIPREITQSHSPYGQGGMDQLAIYLQQPLKFNQNVWRNDLQQKIENCRLQTNQIEQKIDKVDSDLYVPCFFQPGYQQKLIIFFHANGQDISSSAQFLYIVSLETGYSVLALQYRGYSVSQGKTTSKKVEQDAIVLMEYIQMRGFKIERAIVWGRSIGCAVALAVAAKFKQIHCLVLLSPFFSLKQIAKELYGSCAGYIIEESFMIEQNCQQIQCPMLLIHGYKDELSCYQHSLSMMASCPTFCRLKIVEEMTHTRFNFRKDFIKQVQDFLNQIG